MTHREPASVVVIDDHDLFREGIIALLENEPRLVVVADGGTSSAARELVAEYQPSIVLLDVELPGDPADVTIEHLRRSSSHTRIAVLTMHQDAALMRSLISAGTDAYLVKTIRGDALAAALVELAAGARDSVTLTVRRDSADFRGLFGTKQLLSLRELSVLEHIARAESNAQIGAALSIAEGTVKRHITNIFAKLGATSRMDAVRRATEAGILSRYLHLR